MVEKAFAGTPGFVPGVDSVQLQPDGHAGVPRHPAGEGQQVDVAAEDSVGFVAFGQPQCLGGIGELACLGVVLMEPLWQLRWQCSISWKDVDMLYCFASRQRGEQIPVVLGDAAGGAKGVGYEGEEAHVLIDDPTGVGNTEWSCTDLPPIAPGAPSPAFLLPG